MKRRMREEKKQGWKRRKMRQLPRWTLKQSTKHCGLWQWQRCSKWLVEPKWRSRRRKNQTMMNFFGSFGSIPWWWSLWPGGPGFWLRSLPRVGNMAGEETQRKWRRWGTSRRRRTKRMKHYVLKFLNVLKYHEKTIIKNIDYKVERRMMKKRNQTALSDMFRYLGKNEELGSNQLEDLWFNQEEVKKSQRALLAQKKRPLAKSSSRSLRSVEWCTTLTWGAATSSPLKPEVLGGPAFVRSVFKC